MSIQPITCYVVNCAACRTPFDDDNGEIYFATPDDAIRYITAYGWVLTEAGHPICQRCTATALCRRHGHHFTDRTPCGCLGAIPDHALFGCGLFRVCLREGCGHLEDRTLAQLPTTQQPTTPGC
jgi:hypothetical protein